MRAVRRVFAKGVFLAFCLPMLSQADSVYPACTHDGNSPAALPSRTDELDNDTVADESKKCPSLSPATPAELPLNQAERNSRKVKVTITEMNGDPASNLGRASFRLYEDNKEQQILEVKPTLGLLTVGILLEFTGFFVGWYDDVIASVSEFVNQLGPDDCAAIVAYGAKSEVRMDFSRKKSELLTVLQSVRRQTFSDRVNLLGSLDEMLDRMQTTTGRKAILLIGSGFDSERKRPVDSVLRKLEEADVTLYCVGKSRFAPRGLFELREDLLTKDDHLRLFEGESLLKKLAQRSGGAAWFPDSFRADSALIKEIRNVLQSQYQLVYGPESRSAPGKFRKIRIQLVDANGKEIQGLRIRAQDGYVASP